MTLLNYAALFPGKPQLIDRTLSYQNSQLKQSLQFVKVDDDIFAVLTTEIPVALANELVPIETLLKNTILQQSILPNQSTPSVFNLVKESSVKTGPTGQQKSSKSRFFFRSTSS